MGILTALRLTPLCEWTAMPVKLAYVSSVFNVVLASVPGAPGLHPSFTV